MPQTAHRVAHHARSRSRNHWPVIVSSAGTSMSKLLPVSRGASAAVPASDVHRAANTAIDAAREPSWRRRPLRATAAQIENGHAGVLLRDQAITREPEPLGIPWTYLALDGLRPPHPAESARWAQRKTTPRVSRT